MKNEHLHTKSADLIRAADAYFSQTDIAEWRVADAALASGLTCGQILRPDENAPEYDAISYIKLKLESAYELRLNKRGNSGDVFALRCLGWVDKEQGSRTEAVRFSFGEIAGEKY